MKKHILTLITILTMIAAPALAGVWVAQSSYGPVCYLIKYGNAYMGTGIVKGTTFTGWLKSVPNPLAWDYNSSGAYNWTPYADCSNAGANVYSCVSAWGYKASNYNSYGYYNLSSDSPARTVYVAGITVDSARPIACW